MGIRGLTSLIKKYAPDSMSIHPFNYFKGSIVAIDTSILLYKFRYSNEDPNSHINGFLNKCLAYIKNGILPVFIFDGKPPPEKNTTITKRNKQRKRIEFRIDELEKSIEEFNKDEIINKIKKLSKQLINVTKEHHIEVKELLEILGFSVINSPGEAEVICSFLQKDGLVDFTYSDDTDLLALGCKKVLRSNNCSNTFVQINLDKLLKGLDLNIEEFIDLCILCGCDYCSTIPKVNYDVAYKYIKKYRSIENIIEIGNIDVPNNFNYKEARLLFNHNNCNISKKYEATEPIIDETRLTKFLIDRNYKRRYIKNYIRKFKNSCGVYLPTVKSDSSLSSMENYFH